MIFGTRTLQAERERLVAHCAVLRGEIALRAAGVAGKVVAVDRILAGLRRLPRLLGRAALLYSILRRR